MKLSRRILDQKAFVERALGAEVICQRCGATVATYADICSADLSEICPGFLAIERAKRDFDEAQKAAKQ